MTEVTKRKRPSKLVHLGRDTDIVTLFDYDVSVSAFQVPDGRWYPNLSFVSTETAKGERGAAACIALDYLYANVEDALLRGVRIADSMNARIRETDVFEIHKWDGDGRLLPPEYLRLFDDGSLLH